MSTLRQHWNTAIRSWKNNFLELQNQKFLALRVQAAIQINTECVCSLEFRLPLPTVSRKCLGSSFPEKCLFHPWLLCWNFSTVSKSQLNRIEWLIQPGFKQTLLCSHHCNIWTPFLHTFLLCGEKKSATDAFVIHLKKYPYRIAELFPYGIDSVRLLMHTKSHYRWSNSWTEYKFRTKA